MPNNSIHRNTRSDSKKNPGIALMISLISLLLGIANSYFTNFRTIRSVKVNYELIKVEKKGDTITPFFRAIFQNEGNKPEGVLETRYRYNFENSRNAEVEGATQDSVIDAPFLLKSGDAVIRDYKFTFVLDSAQANDSTHYFLEIEYHISGNSGGIIKHKEPLFFLASSQITNIFDSPAKGHVPFSHFMKRLAEYDVTKDLKIELITQNTQGSDKYNLDP